MKKHFLLLVFLCGAKIIFAQVEPPPPPPPPPVTDSSGVFTYAEIMPSAPYNFNQYLSSNIKYPQDALDAGIQGNVYIGFVVEKDGSISNVEIRKSSGNKSLDAEAVRVISSMPYWNAGQVNGRYVRVAVVQPVRFTITKTDNPPPQQSGGK
ncbi:MAG TPA: energy transducer TonB [Bacteroidia bacterium]|jgi:protein TonB|nr:energy transducer TonB [Bacteroidia bacterium]